MFLLAAFLLVPIFFFLLARFVFVIRVLETIFNLLIFNLYKLISNFRSHFLPNLGPFVKVFAVMCISSIAFSSTYTISKGQVIEIAAGDIDSYLIANKDIISAKYDTGLNKIHIKGLMQGFSELKLVGNSKKILKIYVLSKSQQLKNINLKEQLLSMGLRNIQIKGQKVVVKAELESLSEYRQLKGFIKKNNSHIHVEISLKDNLKKQIIGIVYRAFFNEFYDEISCDAEGFDISCKTSQKILSNKVFINSLKKKYFINFIPSSIFSKRNNYQLELRLFQIERLDGQEVQLGLSDLNISITDFINNGIDSISDFARVKLRDSNIHISTLATPKAIIKTGIPLEIKIGSEIPFTTGSTLTDTSQVKWKFAGLKVQLNMERENGNFLITYKTELTRPIQQNSQSIQIGGNRQSSAFSISTNNAQRIFEIGLRTNDLSKTSIPILGKIPILGHLFSSKSNIETHKKVIALVRLTKKDF